MNNQTRTNNLSYLIDLKFSKLHRLFALSFENYNVVIDDKIFFDFLIKKKEEKVTEKNWKKYQMKKLKILLKNN